MCYYKSEVIAMKTIQKLLNEKYAKTAARFLNVICYFVMAFMLVCLVLAFMGRQTFSLRTSTGNYESAIYAEENHDHTFRSFTVTSNDNIYVAANDNDQVDLAVHIGLSLMSVFSILPLTVAYWFLSRVFANVSTGQLFIEKNARYLLYYGVIQFFAAFFVPFIKMFICYLTNLVSNSHVSISTGSDMLNNLIPSIAFIVAAYIIHYGINLQDEVDHTL